MALTNQTFTEQYLEKLKSYEDSESFRKLFIADWPDYLTTPARQQGKSVAFNMLKNRNVESEPQSASGWTLTVDDMDLKPNSWSLTTPKLLPTVAIFESETFPDATVRVLEIELDKAHPRNPNPAAGKAKAWIVRHDARQIGSEFLALPLAKLKAKAIHQQIVDALTEELRDRNPLFGRF